MTPLIRANLLLGLLVLGMSLLLWKKPGLQKMAFTPITHIDTRQVREVRIYHGKKLYSHFKRQQQHWLRQPDQQPLQHPDWLEKVLHIAQLPSLQHFPLGDNDPADYGLQPAQYRLQLDGQSISFGGISPLSHLRYVQTGQTVHLVSDGYTHHLQQPQN